jgi:hypothetical protein
VKDGDLRGNLEEWEGIYQNCTNRTGVKITMQSFSFDAYLKLIQKNLRKGSERTYKVTEQRVYINKDCYFEGIALDVWGFKIGGYQVLDK